MTNINSRAQLHPESQSRRTLGGGLNAVLNAISTDNSRPETIQQELKHVMVHKVSPGKFQPRKEFNQEALQELADSIAGQGILQPIIVRHLGQDEFEIIAGERRWRAAQMAGLQQIPIIICDISDEAALAFGLIENIQRENLNPIEEAFALRKLIDDFGMTHERVAESIGKSRTVVSNMLRLLNLTSLVQDMLISKKLDVGHAKILLGLVPDEQLALAEIIVQQKLTVRAAEKMVRRKKSGALPEQSGSLAHTMCDEWGRALSKKLGSPTLVKLDASGAGQIVIKIDSMKSFNKLTEKL